MTTQPPPPRYRVVEQGRRLVVIETDEERRPVTRREAMTAISATPERISFDGRSILVTRRFYDDKGPRRLTLDPGATRLLERLRNTAIGTLFVAIILIVLAPQLLLFLAVPVLMALHPPTRARARAGVTRWLDRYETEASAG